MSMVDELPILAALDVGSTRFRAVVAEADGRGGVTVLGHASVPAAGLARSSVSDLPAAAAAIAEVLGAAEGEAEVPPEMLAVAVNGDHVRGLSAQGFILLEGGAARVRAEHLDRLHSQVQSVGIPYDQLILHCLPVDYTLDGRRGVRNPLEMVGGRLELDAHVVTASQSAVGALHRAVQMAGSKGDLLVAGACATGYALVGPAEREQGCLLIDIGGEVTQFALFYRGCLRQSGVVPVGGNFVTRDLVYGLRTDPETAEHWKRTFGTALRARTVQPDLSEGPAQAVRTQIAAICQARQQEILELVAQSLQWGITRPSLAAGILLTGGGARLSGTAELAEQVFCLRASERRVARDDQGDEPDSWATVLGLARFAAQSERVRGGRALAAAAGGRSPGIVGNVMRWLEKIV